MKCPACGHPEMVTKVKEETLSHGNRFVTLHSMRGEFCPSCGEGIWDAESYRRFAEAQAALVLAAKGDAESERLLEHLQEFRGVAERREEYGASGEDPKSRLK